MSRKSDLKPGMRVVLKNGTEYLVVDDVCMVSMVEGFLNLDNYSDDLINKYLPKSYSVDKIYKYNSSSKKWEEFPQNIEKKYNINQNFNVFVTFSGNKTTVLLPNGIQASTTCLPEDKYDQDRGFNIALRKAMIKWLGKEMKELSK